jgi:hypothetical protein
VAAFIDEQEEGHGASLCPNGPGLAISARGSEIAPSVPSRFRPVVRLPTSSKAPNQASSRPEG